MADQAPRSGSRPWVRRYGRQRTADGRFAPGTYLYTRPTDGESRWLRYSFDAVDEDCARALWLTDQARRVLTDVFVVIAAVLLIWFVS